ncbi:MAG: 3-phosphoshikimate 1-carboxyvinyltransferase [Candidatus Zixiibacteriota bacterium]
MPTTTRSELKIEPARKIVGHYSPPPDKSIAHRAVILSALAEGRSTVEPLSRAADVASTVSCLRQLGVSIQIDGDTCVIDSPGVDKWMAPERALDCGNSGTTLRLLAGCLAGRRFDATLIGDDSLSTRPMGRIAHPLVQMGARIDLSEGDTAPMTVRGARLRGIDYRLPVASAQVKSAVLLAGLSADGPVSVVEVHPSRDHTERMLAEAGVDCRTHLAPRPPDRREILAQDIPLDSLPPVPDYHHRVVLGDRRQLTRNDWTIPGDFSAAAFFIAAALGARRSDLILANVGLNPTRTGLLKVLRRMGAEMEVERTSHGAGEPFGVIHVQSASHLKAVKVSESEIPSLIDELPVLAMLAARADGVTVIRGAAELRKKETDRIAAVSRNLRAMGGKVAELEDGWAIEGPTDWHGAEIDPQGDHRIAMAFAIAALWADSPSMIRTPSVAAVSDPDFFTSLSALVHN